MFGGKDSKITPATVQKHKVRMEYDEWASAVDSIDILRLLLLKELPEERVGGVINLIFVLAGGGTDDGRENALVRSK